MRRQWEYCIPATFIFILTISDITLFVISLTCLSLSPLYGRHWTGNAYGFLFLSSGLIMTTKQCVAARRCWGVTPFTNSSATFFTPSSLPGWYFRSKLDPSTYLAVQIAPYEDFYPWHWDDKFSNIPCKWKHNFLCVLARYLFGFILVDSLKGYMWHSINYHYVNIKIWTYFWLYNLSLLPVPYVALPYHLPDELKLR